MAAIDDGAKIDIGRVINRAFGAIGRNPLLFVGLAVVLEIVPGLILRVIQAEAITPGRGLTASLVQLVFGLIGLIFYFLFQASIVHATVVDLNDGRPAITDSLALAARLVLPLAGLAIVSGFGIGLASILLFVPGVIVALMWFVAVPAMVEERSGVLASLGRSRALTSGSRWRLFALAIVLLIILYVPFVVLTLAGGGFMAASLQLAQLSVVGVLFIVLNGFTTMLISAIVAATYIDLRVVKDGATSESLASIFA